MPTKERIEKVRKVLSLRQPDLRVVLEEVKNTHNASAVLRTCDAAGVLYLDVICSGPEPFPVNEAISTRAEKWIQVQFYSSASDCLSQLKKKGFKIAGTCLKGSSIPYTALDYTRPTALVFGNESEGISEEALSLADYKIKVPMIGMVQSLNLSVAVGIVLYEAMRQRLEKGFYKKRRLSSSEFSQFMKTWLSSSSKNRLKIG